MRTPLALENAGCLLRRLFDQKAHLGMAGLEIRGDAKLLQGFGSGGPDGSEGYETQFVSDGSKFLYRMVRYEAGPNLKNYPSPLRTDF